MQSDPGSKYLLIFALIFISSAVLIGLTINSGCISSSDVPRDFEGVVPVNSPLKKHIVKKGETLWRIARSHGVPLSRLAGINGIEDPTLIYIGQILNIPLRDENRDVKISTTYKYSYKGGEFLWPLKGQTTRVFDPEGDNHDGIDIVAPKGTPVRAAAAGKVVYSGDQFRGYGNLIIIEHSSTVSSIYAHLSEMLVFEEDDVPAGHIIGRVGQTGRATAPHLHFEVRENNKAVNPHKYLK